MKKPKVSIVCISYNHENFIEDALKGFLLQKTDFQVEIIIADDCSQDKTAEIISKYAKEHTNINAVLRNKNIGVQKNLLEAMDMAKGEYIALCEGDDFWTDPNKLQLQVDFLDKNKDYSVCFHQVEVYFENDEKKSYLSPDDTMVKGDGEVPINQLLADNIIPTNSVLYRQTNDYLNLNMHVLPLDWYLHLHHAKAGKIHYISREMAKNRRHDSGLWWAAQQEPGAIWIKHTDGWIELFEEFLSMFKDQKTQTDIIKQNISNFFEAILRKKTVEEYREFIFNLKTKDALFEYLSEWSVQRAPVLEDEVHSISQHADNQGDIISHQTDKINNMQEKINELENTPWHRLKTKLKIK